MFFTVLADLVVIIHFLFVLFVVFGGFLILHKRYWAYLHIPAAVWGAAIEFINGVCPLTPLENGLRIRGGEAAYASDFIAHYITSALYPAFLTSPLQFILGIFVIAVNICIYGWIICRKKHRA